MGGLEGRQAGTSAIQGTSWAVTSESRDHWGRSTAALGGLAASCCSLVLGFRRGGKLTAYCSLSLAPREPVSRPRPGSHRSGRGSQVPPPGSKRTACGASWPAGGCQRCPGHRPTAASSPVGLCPLLWMEARQLRQARREAAALGHLLLGDVHAWGAHLPGSWVLGPPALQADVMSTPCPHGVLC